MFNARRTLVVIYLRSLEVSQSHNVFKVWSSQNLCVLLVLSGPVTDMLSNVLSYNAENDSEDEADTKLPDSAPILVSPTSVLNERGHTLKQKIMAVGRMARVFKILRQESENCMQLKQLIPNHKLPFGLLFEGKDAIKKGIVPHINK